MYVLPENPPPPPGSERKHLILVVEKLDILDAVTNEKAWRHSSMATEERLRALYHMISELGLYDSVYIDNIPFCYDDRIAFIDTEHFYLWPVHYRRLLHRLSGKRQIFWNQLIDWN